MAASDKKVKGQQTLKLQEFSRPELPPVYNFNFYIKTKKKYYEISFSDLAHYSAELERASSRVNAAPAAQSILFSEVITYGY